jgi:O-antigen/teichoic acid export membrane protein
MSLLRIARMFKSVPRLFSDQSLTKKATLNALASTLDYAANIIVAFVVTPFLVKGLGDYSYGVWQILMRLVGYLSPASGRPTQALKFSLAREQGSTDYERKRAFVGSTLAVTALFLPLVVVLGGVLAWYVPYWLKTPDPYIWTVRITCAILVFNLVMISLVAIPQSVMEGENKGYKRMGISTLLVFVGGGLTWTALYFKTGLPGIAAAAVLYSTIQLIFWITVVRSYSPWFGIARSSKETVREFLKLSVWFMVWNLIMQLMLASDVVVLGLLDSVELVTNYTLSKYAPEMVITVVAMIVFGILPGLGGIIGSGDLARAAKLRGEIMTFTWLVGTVFGASILLWNRTFIGLWVGSQHYVGNLPNLLIVIGVIQFVLIRNDANVIDLTLRLNRKVILGAISVVVSLLAASILVYVFKLGIIGMIVGIMLGRLILSVAYPYLVGQFLKVRLWTQIKSILRPTLVAGVFFLLATRFENYLPTQDWHGISGWAMFILFAALTAGVALVLAFFLGLPGEQRKTILRRIRAVISASPK